MKLANPMRLVPCVSESLRYGGQVRHRQGRIEDAVAMCPRKDTSHKFAPRGDAHRCGRVCVSESDTVADHLVYSRRLYGGMSEGADHLARPVVSTYQQDVRSTHI